MAGPSSLAKISIFNGLSRAELSLLESRASHQRYPAGALVMSEGDQSSAMYVILSGSVRVFVLDENGKEVTIDTMRKQDYFGEFALLDGSKRSASVITAEECDFLVINKDAMIEMFSENPEAAFSLTADLVARIRDLTSTLKNLTLMDIQGRVASELLKVSDSSKQVAIQELMSRIDAPADVIDGVLRNLESSGKVTRDGDTLTINS